MKITKTKGLLAALVLLAGALVPLAGMAASGWGPDRPVKTYTKGVAGFNHVTFNSFVKTDVYGDERTFFDVREQGVSNKFVDAIDVKAGKVYEMRTYIHNGADSKHNASGKGIAKNTKVRVSLPTENSNTMRAVSYISADNAQPKVVWDTATFKSSKFDFNVEYVPGSATIVTNKLASAKLSDNIVKSGATIGYDKLNGLMPGCFPYTAYVTLKVKVNGPSLEMNKQVGLPGGEWQENVQAQPGDTVSWKIGWKNNSKTQLNDVVIKDKLPEGLELVANSVKLYNGKYPSGLQLTDTALFGNGVGVGDYAAGISGYIRFQTKVKADVKEKEICAMRNVASARAEGVPEKEDSAGVTVGECEITPTEEPPEQPPTEQPPVESLPQTGVGGAAAAAAGSGAIGYAVRAYVRSRRALIDALRLK